jgi:drug/metabolite transporter (DMT)-like permease
VNPAPFNDRLLKKKAHLYAFLCALMWSFAYAAIRQVVTEFRTQNLSSFVSSLNLFQIRITLATLPFLPYLFIHRKWILKLTPRDWFRVFLIFLTSTVGYHIPLNLGAQYIPSGFVGLLIGTSPIFAAIFASFFLKEKLTFYRIIAVVLGFVGIVICKLAQNQFQTSSVFDFKGILLVLFAAINGALFAVVGRSIRKDCPVELKLALGLTLASLSIVPFWNQSTLVSLQKLSTLAWINVFYLAITMYISAILYYKALRVLETVKVIIYLNIGTILAIGWGILFFHEQFSALYFLGAVFILVSIFLVNKSSSKSTRDKH